MAGRTGLQDITREDDVGGGEVESWRSLGDLSSRNQDAENVYGVLIPVVSAQLPGWWR
ncbi:MAG: hypothetical protein QW638_01305 [Candidatus Bathyarchaeia archaeon]|nr:hypothetical protein [Candidatus Bathyarchaeota archaeon]